MLANKLALNTDKTYFMLFQPKSKNNLVITLNINLNGIILKQVHSAKFLGVIIDDRLEWKDHIQEIYCNLVKYSSIFYKIRNKLSLSTMKNIYFATVHPKLLYGIEIYANTCPSYLDRLITLNNKLLRIVQNKKFDCPTSSLYLDFNTLPINLLFKYNCLRFAHKLVFHKHLLPNIFSNYFVSNNDVHAHNTRAKKLIHLGQYNKNIGQRNFNYFGGILWNNISESLRETINMMNQFKNSIKAYLLELLHCI